MAKSLSVRIAERATKRKPSQGAQNRAIFLGLRAEITQAIDDGWAVKTIWETLHEEGKVAFSYQAFRGYVNRLVLVSRAGKGMPASVVADPTRDKVGQMGQAPVSGKTVKPAGVAGFKFGAAPKKEDLL
jgi:hypothetical protein